MISEQTNFYRRAIFFQFKKRAYFDIQRKKQLIFNSFV